MEIGKRYILCLQRSDGNQWIEAICAKPSEETDGRNAVMFHAYCGFREDGITVGVPHDEVRNYHSYICLDTAIIKTAKP